MSIASHNDTSLLRLRVVTNAARDEITGLSNGVIQVKIAAPPVKGKANRELLAFLSQLLGIGKGSLTIVKGVTSHHKVVSVVGLPQEETMKRLFPEIPV